MAIHAANFHELKIDRLSREFGTLSALKEVNLTIRQGEFIALLGPSGCGKSTTLNILAGLLPATGGGIWLDERRIDRLRPEERGFGMVFQNYALFPHMNVRKNIGFGLMMRGIARAEAQQRINDAIGLVHLQGQEISCRVSSRAVSSSASRLLAPSSSSRRLCSWTNRSRTSTQSSAWRCERRSGVSIILSAPLQSTSRMTRRRLSRWQTALWYSRTV